jgi:Uma2 family endonuclease
MATQSVPKITEEEYLRLERAAERKSEFVDGEIFEMPGGSARHAQLAVNWIVSCSVPARDAKCRVFSSDLRIRTSATGAHVYPDLSIVQGVPEFLKGARDILINPVAVVEVISPSTANYDRGKKFDLYREIPSLKDYVLVHPDSPYVEHFARQADESWIYREYQGLASSITVSSIGCVIKLVDAYAGVLDLPE